MPEFGFHWFGLFHFTNLISRYLLAVSRYKIREIVAALGSTCMFLYEKKEKHGGCVISILLQTGIQTLPAIELGQPEICKFQKQTLFIYFNSREKPDAIKHQFLLSSVLCSAYENKNRSRKMNRRTIEEGASIRGDHSTIPKRPHTKTFPTGFSECMSVLGNEMRTSVVHLLLFSGVH
jgi:hypothetical protein